MARHGTAQTTLSPGCTALNDPALDRQQHANSVGPLQFFAGDEISVTGDQPATATRIELRIGHPVFDTLVDQEPFPGTLTYTFPAETFTGVSWYAVPEIVEGMATRPVWTVTCTAAAYPLAVSSPQPAGDVATLPAAFPSGADSGFPLGTVVLVAGAVLLHAVMAAAVLRRRGQASD